MNLGDILSELREERSLTQLELSKRLHISNSSISAYETGARVPSVEALRSFAVFYDVTTDYLLGLTEDSISPAVLSEEFTGGVKNSSVLKMLEALSSQQKDAILLVIKVMKFYTEVTGKTAADGVENE